MTVYFLTGGTGAVGSAIVPLLLDDPDTEVRLLLRADSDAGLSPRIEELVRFWGWSNDERRRARVKALRGDAAAPRFGLSECAYGELVRTCTHVIHCAGSVRMNLPLDEARRSAVGSAKEICALAQRLADGGMLRKVEFVSTVGVAGKRPGALPEAWMDEPRAFHNTYEQAKAEAEEIVRDTVERDALPLTVHRPSMVIGNSRHGRIIHFQIFYFICEFLSGRKTYGIYPAFGDVRLDVIPVDYVAEAIASASRDPRTIGRIFHLSSGPERSPRLEEIKVLVRQAFLAHGLRLPPGITLPRSWYGTLARLGARLAPRSRRKALATLPIYLDYLADRQGFDNGVYREWLAARGRALPGFQDYLPRVLGHYLDRRYPVHGRT